MLARFILVLAVVFASCKTPQTGSQTKDSFGTGAVVSDRHPCSLGASSDIAQYRDSTYRIPWDVLETAARMSVLAYEPPATISREARQLGYTSVDVATVGNLVVAVVSNDDCVMISFRGTDDLRDWFTNTSVLKKTVRHGKVHSGFLSGAKELGRRVSMYLQTQWTPGKKVWVTGHSLGGALAGVFTYHFAQLVDAEIPAPEYLVTFGQPAFADEALAKYFSRATHRRYYRVVNNRDIVPRVPPAYKHSGSLVWFDEGVIKYRPVVTTMAASVAAASSAPAGAMSMPVADPFAELEPNESDFAAFMEGASEAAVEQPEDGESPQDSPVVAASVRMVDDHSMTEYERMVKNQMRNLR